MVVFNIKSCCLVFVNFLLIEVSINAQSAATIELSITDSVSNSVNNFQVYITDSNDHLIVSKIFSEHKSVKFINLPTSKIKITVESPGFEPYSKVFELKPGKNSITIQLEIKKIEEKVEITQSEIDKALDRAFNQILTQDEIDSLPNDPQKIEEELKRRYGDDLVIRVNGFTGGMIPPKEMIKSIAVNRSSFDAEFHELGTPNINITTKAMLPKTVGSVFFNYGNSALNARNAFAKEKLPQQNIMFMGMLAGPLTRKSSYMASVSRMSNNSEINVYSNNGGGFTSRDLTRTMNSMSFNGGINYDLNDNHTLRFNFSNSSTESTNLGIGGLSLPSRGFGMKSDSNNFRFSDSGTIAKKYNQEFRTQFSWNNSETKSNSDAIGITIGGAYSGGGAGIDNSSNDFHFEAFEMISFGVGKNLFKFGGELNFDRKSVFSADGTNGSFYFRNIQDYLNRIPATFTQTIGTSEYAFTRTDFAAFFQSDFRISRRIQAGFGLRYEVQTELNDKNNFSPRLSFAYVLDKKAKYVVRTGAGILYNWFDANKIERILSDDGSQASENVIINPGYPIPASGGILSTPLPPSIRRQALNLKNPYIFVTQTLLNAAFKPGFTLNASYKFERGIRMFRTRDINAPFDGIRPDPAFGRINYLESSGLFTRNSFQVSGSAVLFKRVSTNARYLLAKSTDDYDGAFSLPADNYNLQAEKGASDNDRRHIITGSFNYAPYNFIQITPNFTITSPLPYTITTGLDNNGDTVYNDRPFGVARNSARGAWSRTANLTTTWTIPFLKRPQPKIDGKAIEGSESLPGILKYHNLMLTVSINNIFNNVNYRGYIGNQLSPLYGKPTNASSARSINFSLMFIWF
ncbi:MAG: hypothetical protein ACK5NT_05650 [Pyrinomonadaceae bacterium]